MTQRVTSLRPGASGRPDASYRTDVDYRTEVAYRRVRPEDFDAMHSLVSEWEVARNLGSWPWPPDTAFTHKRCVPFEGDGFLWAICVADRLIGTVSVVRGELGYMLHPDHQGQGVVTCAVQDALCHAFDALNMRDVHSEIWADNAASRHILTQAGFTLSREYMDHSIARNEATASETYTLSHATWVSRHPPRLVTKRLVLRPLSKGDADDIVRIAGNYEVSRWLMPVPHPYAPSDAQAFLARVLDGEEGPVWAVTQEVQMIGVIGLDDMVGYYLQPESWGQGLMSEAVAAAVSWRFSLGDLDRIRSGFFDGNDGSRRVLEKAGFRPTGRDMSYSTARGEQVPHTRMELTRATWSALMRAPE